MGCIVGRPADTIASLAVEYGASRPKHCSFIGVSQNSGKCGLWCRRCNAVAAGARRDSSGNESPHISIDWDAVVRFAAELCYDVTVVKDATADYSDDAMHAALDVNITNSAAIMTTNEVVVFGRQA